MSWDFGEGVYNAKAAALRAEATRYMSKAERNQTLLAVIDAYYGLLTAQLSHAAYRQLAAQADTIARQLGVQVEAGLRYQSELLLAQSNHSNRILLCSLGMRWGYGL